eukprot:CAMPEP_0206480426 /NCGR_PEP_ID=MMETSP0324_2-20121206/37319_1 /ASSEMBLY_ACC=CAM_ASM_000836 /TAXON_ID=2866 /ORGANISM="Crypthecodinium cohnii, Strain Seligo" /LENGTH=594 /DNA_ID=CAMNT_0053957275 /DNA_START=90 /DNA_END=1874 /DNA_ORIENTATION=+
MDVCYVYIARNIDSGEFSKFFTPDQRKTLRREIAKCEKNTASSVAVSWMRAAVRVLREIENQEFKTPKVPKVTPKYSRAVEQMACAVSTVCSRIVKDDAEPAERTLVEIADDIDSLVEFFIEELARVDPTMSVELDDPGRIIRSIQGSCAWIMAAIHRLRPFTPEVFWDFASEKVHSSAILSKGLLAASYASIPGDWCVTDFNLPLPANIRELQRQAFLGFCCSTSPSAAAATLAAAMAARASSKASLDESDSEASEHDRQEAFALDERNILEVQRHRREIARALIETNSLISLFVFATGQLSGCDLAVRFISFLVALLSVPPDPTDPRDPAPELRKQVLDADEALWYLLCRTADHEAENSLPGLVSMLGECVLLSTWIPPPTRGANPCLHQFIEYVAQASSKSPLLCPLVLGRMIAVTATAGIHHTTCFVEPMKALTMSQRKEIKNDWKRLEKKHKILQAPTPWPDLSGWNEFFGEFSLSRQPDLSSWESVQALKSEVPSFFWCELGGTLLLDPVQTPYGHICERETLKKHLDATGKCPLTGAPMTIGECHRQPELRQSLLKWIHTELPRVHFEEGSNGIAKAPHRRGLEADP